MAENAEGVVTTKHESAGREASKALRAKDRERSWRAM